MNEHDGARRHRKSQVELSGFWPKAISHHREWITHGKIHKILRLKGGTSPAPVAPRIVIIYTHDPSLKD